MVSLSVASLLLGFLLVSQILISSSADQGWRIMRGNWLKENHGIIASVQKGELVGVSATEIGKGQLGGRKMALIENGLKKGKMQTDGENSTSQITGNDKSASIESLEGPQNLLKFQKNEDKLGSRTLESQNLQKTNQQFKTSLSTEAKLDLEGSLKPNNEENGERLLEEALKKVMQLMRKDYGGMRKPRHRPPVNNNEPND